MKKQSLERIPRSLNAITEDIQDNITKLRGLAVDVREVAWRIGVSLIEAKDQVGHGEWGGWLALKFELTARTAQQWMALARAHPDGLPKAKLTSDLTLTKLIEATQKPKPKADKPKPATPPQTPENPPQGGEPDDDWLPDGATESGSHEADNPADEALGEGHTVVEATVVPDPLIEAQKGLDELAEKIDEAITLARKVFKVQGREITQPFLKHFTWTGVIGNLMDYEHSLEDNRPVGGTPDKPETVRTQKAREALKK